jgi:hypothetical protein
MKRRYKRGELLSRIAFPLDFLSCGGINVMEFLLPISLVTIAKSIPKFLIT